LLKTGRQPNILHCHDWSTAHVAKAFWEDYQPYGLYNPKVNPFSRRMNYEPRRFPYFQLVILGGGVQGGAGGSCTDG
jgi:hypothetical protein